MLLTIYDKSGTKRADVAVSDSSTQMKEVQGGNVLALSFTYYEHVALDVNDYTDFMGERYWLTEKYAPKEKSEGEWEYDVKLYGIESLIKRFLVLETTDGDTNPLFTLTSMPRDHVAMVVKAINDGMGNITDWKVGQVDGTDLIVIDYEGMYCDEALKAIAEKVGGKAEWWVEGQTVNVCRCEHGEEITLGYGKGLTSLERDTSNTAKFYTRLFPIGSSRNIDPEKYGSPRLMLPGKKKYVEVGVDEYGIYDHYEQAAFSGIYPRRVGTVSSVRSEEVKDEEGKAFTVYYFKDDGLDFDPNDYELAGETKRVSFQSGDLSGLGEGDDHYFEVNFDSGKREFEIITIWPYDDKTQLPGGKLIPKAGDTYVLWNIRMPDEYYRLAEDEFQKAVDDYNKDHWLDIAAYKAPTDHVWIEEQEADLFVGRRVKLESAEYFPKDGYRRSRITKITRKVNLPEQMDLEISDALQVSKFDRVNDSIGELKSYTKAKAESSGLPDIIRSFDNTLPTDNNLFSARRSQKEFLSKRHRDTAAERIGFLKGISLGEYRPGKSGGGMDGDGNAEFLTAVIRELLRSTRFVDGMFGEGWQLWMDRITGLSNLTIDKITVRRALVALELLIERVRSVGGQLVVSAANGKIKKVLDEGESYRITFEQENMFLEHDLIRCATYTGEDLRGYWVEVSGSDASGITVGKDEFSGTPPKEGDEVVLMGNTENPSRQNLISISATEDGQPRIDVLDGVREKHFNGALRARLGNLDGINDDWFLLDNQPHGNGLYSDNVYLRGSFVLATGEDVKTKFDIMEGRIESSVEGIRTDLADSSSYLSNASFADGMDKWETESDASLYSVDGQWVWMNGRPYSRKSDYAAVLRDGGRPVLYVRNQRVTQRNGDFRKVPVCEDMNDKGERKPEVVYLTFHYRVSKPGWLSVGFENVDKDGFENFNQFAYEGELGETEGYRIFSHSGLWNGTGDFRLSFTGEMRLYMVVLSMDRAEALAYKYKTLFEQSDKLVRIAASSFDKDGNVLESSSIVTTAKYNRLISERFNDDGSLKNRSGLVTTSDFASMFAQAVDGNGLVRQADISTFITRNEAGQLISNATIRADQISLKGAVTFDSLSPSLQGTINGKVNSSSLGGLAYEDAVNASQLGSTIVVGGYLNTDYIKVRRIDADGARVGGFTLDSGRLNWKGNDYFGQDSRSVKIGVSHDATEGVVDIAFNAATEGRFGLKSVGANMGGSAIYGSTGAATYPPVGMSYAGFFVGPVDVRDSGNGLMSDVCASKAFRVITGRNANGTYTYHDGVNWNKTAGSPDLDRIRLIVESGIITGYYNE